MTCRRSQGGRPGGPDRQRPGNRRGSSRGHCASAKSVGYWSCDVEPNASFETHQEIADGR
jgi:hypothetical protein